VNVKQQSHYIKMLWTNDCKSLPSHAWERYCGYGDHLVITCGNMHTKFNFFKQIWAKLKLNSKLKFLGSTASNLEPRVVQLGDSTSIL